ncbi:hypothetical protein NE237_032258 [Protea cynaroides]|uniref:Subtilisin-like protease n=1 Tax=Protea cynaroides TaxID=273540 RepID=A0A9Q0L3N8_9MAGN|nr:hypothetical protein NE237_032258 [Protea cynaroides]
MRGREGSGATALGGAARQSGVVTPCPQKAKDAIFYSYSKHINGFAANLEEEEALKIAEDPRVVSVFESKAWELQTTHSWEFLGLEKNGTVEPGSLWEKARYGADTIIANLDTGYEAAVGPLNSSYNTPRDEDGHGTHTLSTAGGNFVSNASVFGYGDGTAKGGSPKARLATYKVCWPDCYDADILAAFDAAIADGVDIISVSLGGLPTDYFNDGIAIGAFHAIKAGVLVVCSAGNSGPFDGTVSNVAPWMFTIAASTMDREFAAYVELGNGKKLMGQSLSPDSLPAGKMYPVVNAADVALPNVSSQDAQLCEPQTLDPTLVKGKIVVCLRGVTARVDKGEQALFAGAVGMILANDPASANDVIADAHVLPASMLSYNDGVTVYAYLNSTSAPTAYITRPVSLLYTKPAPVIASFSSKGPNTVTPGILKPDITAPGVSVIAAWSNATSPTGEPFDNRRVAYNCISGTSMSCPHVSGVSGLLKTLYPSWSPSAIRSAIMTTARTRDNEKEPIMNATFQKADPFSYGAGHVRPNRAMDPGLVYDLTTNDYYNFLCAVGYNETLISLFSDSSVPYKCPKTANLMNFNYPSFSVPSLSGTATLWRTLKNVGPPAIYTAFVHAPLGTSVSVKPGKLKFDFLGQEKSFKLTIKSNGAGAAEDYVFGHLTWTDDVHYVRSPIAVMAAAA